MSATGKVTAKERANLASKRVVDALRARDVEYRVYDSKLAGFGLRIATTGARSYFVQYRANGVSRRMYIGDARTLAPAAARKLAGTLLESVKQGKDPLVDRQQQSRAGPAAARAKRAEKTVDDVASDYLKTLELTKSGRWSVEARRLYDVHLKPSLGMRKIVGVDPSDVRRLHEKLHKTPALANRVRAVLSAIITRAVVDGVRPPGTNPCAAIEKYTEPPRSRYLTSEPTDEWKALGEAIAAERTAAREPSRRDTVSAQLDAVVLLALTGARKEAVTLRRWRDVDWTSHVLKVDPPHKGCSQIYLGAAALAQLRTWYDERGTDSQFIFPGQRVGTKRAAAPIATIRPVWSSLCTRAKLNDVRPHDLRRSFATVAGEVGVSGHMIGGLLSHVVPGVTGVYAHRPDPALVKEADRVSEEIARRLGLTRGDL